MPTSRSTPLSAPPSADELSVAFDIGPLHGQRTGVGNAVAWTRDALDAAASVALLPYVTSMRARLEPGVRRLPLPAAVAHRWWPHRSPPLDRLLGRPDVVHGTNYVVPPARCVRLVSVYDCWFLDHPDEAVPDVARSARVLRRAVADGASVVTSSKATAERVRELLDTDRVTPILLGPPPLGPCTAPAAGGAPTGDSPFVLAVGTIERRKNIPTLIDAFARLAHEDATVRLVIAGSMGDDGPAVDRAIGRLAPAVAARCSMLGAIGDDAKASLLARAAVLAYPSLDEGFGFPILEAARAGTPVVASAVGSIPEVAGSAALLSAPTDAEALAANLHWALTDDDIRTKLIARGHRNLRRFSWERTARELAALYRSLAERSAT